MQLLEIAKEIFSLCGGRKIQLYKKTNPEKTNLLINHTSFVQSPGIIERAYCIINNINKIPTCRCCNNKVKWYKEKRKYRIYCSLQCKGSDPTLKDKVKKTVKEKYKVENVSQSDHIKAKKIKTCINNHGVKYPQQSKEVHQKSINRNILNHGVEYPLQSKVIRRKVKKTNLERIGVENPMQSEIVKRKTQLTNLKKYGTEHFSQKHIPKQILSKLQDKEWLHKEHIIKQKSLLQIADELDVNDGTVARYLHSYGIETQLFYSSLDEKLIGKFVRSFGFEVITNIRNILPNNLELDIYIPELKLAIEYCGLYWHSEEMGKHNNYHLNKYTKCKKLGIRLLTIFEDEWLHKRNIIENKIKYILNKTNDRVFARKCICTTIDKNSRKSFLDKYHIQGDGKGSINYALMYENKIVACITFIKNKNDEFILNRYATNTNVVGGFSKLLSHFCKQNKWLKIITFADLRWSNGDLYDNNGFVCTEQLKPDYSYIDSKNRIRKHKFNYRKPALNKMFDDVDGLTEREICKKNNIFKIWNCGLKKYIKNNYSSN